MTVPPLASIVIPTRNRRETLRRALDSLADQTAPRDSYEVVICVDGSTDGTRQMLDAYTAPYRLEAVPGPERGRAAACNTALGAARGEILIVLDDDMQVVPAFVECHRRHHPPGSRLCVLGAVPVQLTRDSPHVAVYVQAKFAAHLARLEDPAHVYTPRDFYSGNSSLRTEILRDLGGFDESFTAYGNEDVELFVRLRDAEVAFRYDSEAVAYQEYGKSLRALMRDTYDKGGTTVLLARRHPEVFDVLRLSSPYEASRPWLVARAVLLAAARRVPGTVSTVFALSALLERLGLWRRLLFYRPVLDYAFWAGVDAQLLGGRDRTMLAELRAKLRRGPIDLLIHDRRERR